MPDCNRLYNRVQSFVFKSDFFAVLLSDETTMVTIEMGLPSGLDMFFRTYPLQPTSEQGGSGCIGLYGLRDASEEMAPSASTA